MVAIHLPPPTRPVTPLPATIPAGNTLVRIFDPTDHDQTACSFRFAGPFRRFDHHRTFGTGDVIDPERGIYYAARSLNGCLVEVFGDTGFIETGDRRVAMPRIVRDLHLLDLRDDGAWRAGSVSALANNADYGPSQAWSRYFYEHPDIYSGLDGLVYANAHNGDTAVALYERAAAALECDADAVISLDDPALRPALLDAGLRLGLVLL